MSIRDEIVLDYTRYKRDLNKVDSLPVVSATPEEVAKSKALDKNKNGNS